MCKFAFRDESLPLEQRVDDLISRLTVEEKVFQLTHDAASIPRLGIRSYCYWNEALNNRKSIREDQKSYFCPSLRPSGSNHDTFTTYGAFIAAVALPAAYSANTGGASGTNWNRGAPDLGSTPFTGCSARAAAGSPGGFTNVHNNRGNLAYSDGHAGSSTPQEFRETMRKVWKDDAKVIYYRDAADGFKVIN